MKIESRSPPETVRDESTPSCTCGWRMGVMSVSVSVFCHGSWEMHSVMDSFALEGAERNRDSSEKMPAGAPLRSHPQAGSEWGLLTIRSTKSWQFLIEMLEQTPVNCSTRGSPGLPPQSAIATLWLWCFTGISSSPGSRILAQRAGSYAV